VTYIVGRATDKDTLKQLRGMVKGKKTMVVLDSNHARSHVKRELLFYGDLVTPGQYLVVEDTFGHKGPWEAVQWFMQKTKKYSIEHPERKYGFTLSPDGWLKRV
jgi:cephalosporin hydroxylase